MRKPRSGGRSCSQCRSRCRRAKRVNGGRRWTRCFTSTEVHSFSNLLGTGSLVKESLAASLKNAITEGRLVPGQRVVEGKWAREFGVAQASVREAINLLISEGYVV